MFLRPYLLYYERLLIELDKSRNSKDPQMLRQFKFTGLVRTIGLISGLFSLSPLYSAAAGGDHDITAADQAAFKAVMQIHGIVKAGQATASHDGPDFYSTDNPALIFDIKY